MTGPAWQAWRDAAAIFAAPPGSGPWRADVALGSGLTALAVEAALRDVALARDAPAGQVVADPGLLDPAVFGGANGRLLACSYSAQSSEVLDGMEFLRSRGLPCDLHGAGLGADLPTPDVDVFRPARHAVFCATVPALLGAAIAPRPSADAAVAAFLGEVDDRGLIPLFAAPRGCFRARALLAYWLEYMQRPGFGLIYPDFTHDFMWAGVRSRMRAFAFVLRQPDRDLSDGRFRELCGLLRAAGTPHLVLDGRPLRDPGAHIGYVIDAADAVLSLAAARRRDLATELTFENWASALAPS